MNFAFDSDQPAILRYLRDPDLPSVVVESFFRAAIEFADARPWSRLAPAAHFPILLRFFPRSSSAGGGPFVRLALIVGGAQSGGDALGLILCEGLPGESDPCLSSPALTVLYAGYPAPDLVPILWRGRPLPRSRTGLLPWPTIHGVDDRVRAPRKDELVLLTAGLLTVRAFVASYPAAVLDDNEVHPHACEVEVGGGGPGDSALVRAVPFPVPS